MSVQLHWTLVNAINLTNHLLRLCEFLCFQLLQSFAWANIVAIMHLCAICCRWMVCLFVCMFTIKLLICEHHRNWNIHLQSLSWPKLLVCVIVIMIDLWHCLSNIVADELIVSFQHDNHCGQAEWFILMSPYNRCLNRISKINLSSSGHFM